jgi:cation diffusion facilitator CzcD-associated flavoprotein CzcO
MREKKSLNYSTRYCIIGAGSSGLAAAKNLKAHHIPCDVIEREDEVGGLWYYGKPHTSIYRSTHLISSKPLTEFTDFPMPAHYPDYPNHTQVLEYLRSYARTFGLYELITFNTSVEKIEPAVNHWEVTLSNGQTRRYRGVIIANGHNWNPKYPAYAGHFDGLVLHSAYAEFPGRFGYTQCNPNAVRAIRCSPSFSPFLNPSCFVSYKNEKNFPNGLKQHNG